MKTVKKIILYAFILLGVTGLVFARSGSRELDLANTEEFDITGVGEIRISTGQDTVTFLPGNPGKLVIREYMNRNNPSYYAKIKNRGGKINIQEGGRPLIRSGFVRRMEVYLPPEYNGFVSADTSSGSAEIQILPPDLSGFEARTTSGTISFHTIHADTVRLATTSGTVTGNSVSGNGAITNTSGTIKINTWSAEDGVTIKSTSGGIELGAVKANRINIETVSARMECGTLAGNISYRSTSGSLSIETASGSGSFEHSAAGDLHLSYTSVTGNISVFNKNGTIFFEIPGHYAGTFEAETREGTITTNFMDRLSGSVKKLSGVINRPGGSVISLETRNGHIRAGLGISEPGFNRPLTMWTK